MLPKRASLSTGIGVIVALAMSGCSHMPTAADKTPEGVKIAIKIGRAHV